MKATFLAVLLTLSSVALVGPAAQADPISDPTRTSYSLGVMALAYFPLTPDGQNIDIGVTGDVGDLPELERVQHTGDHHRDQLRHVGRGEPHLR